jgi:hypothetical protein
MQNTLEIMESGSAVFKIPASDLERYAKSLYTWQTQQI